MDNKLKTTIIKISISSSFFLMAIVTCCFNLLNNFHVTTFLLAIAYLIAGYNIILKTIKNTISLNFFDENFLMFMATIGTIYLNEYFEAVTIILFYQIGELFQKIAIDHSNKSIKKLVKNKPIVVNLKTKEGITQTKPESVETGSIIIIKPGEQIPIDGTIVSGTSQINTSSINGEFKPSTMGPNSKILSGYINLTNTIEVRTEALFKDSTIKKILNIVENAKQKKSNSEKFITKFAKIYTPIVVLIALLVILIPTVFLNQSLKTWLQSSIVLLSISCPCALVISIPLSFFGAITATAKNSILIKTNSTLEKINKTKTVVFDKTGTLTIGEFEIVEINPKKISENELIKILITAESLTNHPIATAIKSKFKNFKYNINEIKKFEEIPGFGIKATTTNNTIYVGNEKLMKKYKILYDKKTTNKTIIYIAKNQTYLGNVIVSDKIRPEAKHVVEQLRKLKIKNILMLTGDEKIVAEKTAKFLNLNSSFSKQLPNEKVDKIKKFQKYGPLIFIGDGINDSPALATADIGIAMGKSAADIAIDSADVILVDNNLKKILDIFKISKKTIRIIKQNIIISILIKVLIILTGIIGKTNIWFAIFSDVGVSTIAVSNALRTLKHKT